MSRSMDEVSDEALEGHLRKRITPEIVEWMRRKEGEVSRLSPLDAKTDAAFGAVIGTQETMRDLLSELERLLTESLDPEFR
jgi:hypothetical protein